jgi:RNA polymerase sigma factor (sigma-70 family)
MSPVVSSDALFAEVQRGDAQAALELFRRYRRLFKSFGRRWLDRRPELRHACDSDDLSQEAFWRFYEGLLDDRLKVRDEEHAQRLMAIATKWAGKRVVRHMSRECRDGARTQPLGGLDPVANAEPEPDEAAAAKETAEAALSVLGPQDRRIVESHFIGWTWAEIADQAGLTVEAARSRFRRAMETIKKLVKNL